MQLVPLHIGAHPPPGDPGGYDHNFALVNYKPDEASGVSPVALAAEVSEPETGRCMEVSTDVPGVQFYTGNFLNDVRGKGGAVYNRHAGFCLETQHFPDAVNQPNFVSCVLVPGQTYRHNMVHRFFTKPR
jgi:aldose 1-epimerase